MRSNDKTTARRWSASRTHRLGLVATAGASALGLTALLSGATPASADEGWGWGSHTSPISHVMVIDLENEGESTVFGSSSPITYLTNTLEPQGTLIPQYYAIGHVSADNYIAQVSGQAPNLITSSDCITAAQPGGSYDDVLPGTLDPNQVAFPGQVDGQGCVFPSSVQTIGTQLEAQHGRSTSQVTWREYAEDMGNDPVRDGGTPDPLGGTDCAHPTQVAGQAVDLTNSAEGPNGAGAQHSTISDQYADRHNPFIYFHSTTDNAASCVQHVVPLGSVELGTGGQPNVYSGHLAQDLAHSWTTPAFSFVTPNLCNDGHDATCAGTNTDGTTAGGLTGINAWLSAWMPLIMNSPAYRDGSLTVVLTSDEASLNDSTAGGGETPGPNSTNPGYSPLLNSPIAAFGGKTYYQLLGVTGITPGVAPSPGSLPGGGQIGALVLDSRWVRHGYVDTTGVYNHYSALRSYEDLLGIDRGGADGHGHLGFASTAQSFGSDVFTFLGDHHDHH